MTKYHAHLRSLALSTAALVLSAQAAFAQDVTDVADRLKALVLKQGMDIAWSNITGDASNMVMEGVTIKTVGEPDTLPIGNVSISGVSEKDGGFLVETVSTDPLTFKQMGYSFEASPLVFNDLTLPAEDSTDPMASFAMYRKASLDSLSIQKDGKTAFSIQNLKGEMTPAEGSGPMEFSGGVEKFNADLSLIEDPRVKGYLQALGYSQIDGDVKMHGSWQPADGRWSMPQYDITVNDVGTIGMTMDLGGLTPEFLSKANELSTKMAASGEPADKAQELELMGMFSAATFNGASLRFADDSLTGRIINLIATMQGAQPADVVNMAKGAIPMGLMQAQMMDLANEITPAINAYLDDPKSLEIVATPSKPVAFSEIGAASMASPENSVATAKALWSLMGIKVVANQ